MTNFERSRRPRHSDMDDDWLGLKTPRDAFTKEGASTSFKCSHCGLGASSAISAEVGSNHRDHCPRCLWSKHVAKEKLGDRESNCRAGMRPIGITLHRSTGEPLIVLRCSGCDVLRTSRCLLDDDVFSIMRVFESSTELDPEIVAQLSEQNILILSASDREILTERLVGAGNAGILTTLG